MPTLKLSIVKSAPSYPNISKKKKKKIPMGIKRPE